MRISVWSEGKIPQHHVSCITSTAQGMNTLGNQTVPRAQISPRLPRLRSRRLPAVTAESRGTPNLNPTLTAMARSSRTRRLPLTQFITREALLEHNEVYSRCALNIVSFRTMPLTRSDPQPDGRTRGYNQFLRQASSTSHHLSTG